MIKTKACFTVEKEGKRFELYCDADTPCGVMHDALMEMKKWVVDRMLVNQQNEEALAKKQQSVPDASEGEQEACQPEPSLMKSEV